MQVNAVGLFINPNLHLDFNNLILYYFLRNYSIFAQFLHLILVRFLSEYEKIGLAKPQG